MSKYIYSTLSCDNKYVRYVPITSENKQLQKELPLIHTGADGREHHVTIKGGANVARKDGAMDTPEGVRTKISDEDFEWLQHDPHFLQHQKKGFLVVGDAPVNADKVSKDMVGKDKSAPKTPDDPEYQPGYSGQDGAQVAETSKGIKNKGK